MAFSRRTDNGTATRRLLRALGAALRACWRVALGLTVVAATAGGLLYVRLLQGPLHLPAIGRIVAERIAPDPQSLRVSVGDMVLTLGDADGPPGIRFLDVRVASPGGTPLISAPQVGARFRGRDLLALRPSEIVLIAPRARLTRLTDGRLQLGMGEAGRLDLSVPDGDPGTAAFDPADLPPGLERVRIVRAEFSVEDARTGTVWTADRLDIDATRRGEGLDLSGRAVLAGGARLTGRLALGAGWQSGTATLALAGLSVDGLPEGLHGAALSGQVSANVEALRLMSLEGVLVADGQEAAAFDRISLGFTADPDLSRVEFERFQIAAPGIDAMLHGLLEIGPGGERAAAQLTLDDLSVDRPDLFDTPIRFQDGAALLRWHGGVIDIQDGYLAAGDVRIGLTGRALLDPAPVLDLRAAARDLTVPDVIAHWPRPLAPNARRWVAENITSGVIERVTAQTRIGAGAPQLGLDFSFDAFEATYLGALPAITGATGTGTLSIHDLVLDMEAGGVSLPGGRIDIAGSRLWISDFAGAVTPADIRLTARGGLEPILTLLDREPLGFIAKLGLDSGGVAGTAETDVALRFPLINTLSMAQVEVAAEARLANLALSHTVAGRPVRLRGRRLRLSADRQGLRLAGKVEADGVPLDLDWRERYGRTRGRSLSVSGALPVEMAGTLGLGGLDLAGPLPVRLELDQAGDGPGAFTLDADLVRAAFGIPQVGWRKDDGGPARLTASGTFGETIAVDRFKVAADGLEATGALTATPDGRLIQARIGALEIPGRADVSATLAARTDDALAVEITGRLLDLSRRSREPRTGDGIATAIDFSLDRLQLTGQLAMTAARGRLERDAAGGAVAAVAGDLGGLAAVEASVTLKPDGSGVIRLEGDDAGAVLDAAGIYRGGSGGTFLLDAAIGGPGAPLLDGRAKMTGMRVESRATFRSLLSAGGLDAARTSVEQGGLAFRTIRVPFRYDGSTIEVRDAVARSTALGITADGTVNEADGTVDFVGVISPAYGLTGALDEIPVLGELISGGKGEGILAMTFTLDGPKRDPQFSVNPLSLLTPGFLRNIFRGGNGGNSEAAQDLLRRIRRED